MKFLPQKIITGKLTAALLIVIVGIAAYGNSLNCPFVWDDHLLITDNVYIRSWAHLPKIFSRSIATGAATESDFYRPLQIFTYMIDYFLWRLDPKGYHLTNILLHILVALSIYRLVNLLYRDGVLSLLTGILFIAHPVHTQAVTYISGRADSLAALFMLICFILYIRNLTFPGTAGFVFVLITYAFALLSKEYSLILPVLLLLYHRVFRKKFRVKLYFPLLFLAVGYVFLRVAIFRPLSLALSSTSLLERIPGFLAAIFNYLKILLVSFNLHMEYGNVRLPFTDPRAIIGLVILAAFLGYGLGFKTRHGEGVVLFSLSWFFLALLPVSNLYPINAYMAEHWLYFPSIGFFLLLAKGLRLMSRPRKFRMAGLGLTVAILGFWLIRTIQQNNYWRDPVAFYRRTLKYAPGSARVYTNLGTAYEEAGKIDQAIDSYQKARKIDPSDAKAYLSLGLAYADKGLLEEALIELKKAGQIDPRDLTIRNGLGLVYIKMGLYDEAVSEFEKILAEEPDYAFAHFNLGVAYEGKEQLRQARSEYQAALRLNPHDANTCYNLGHLYQKTGEFTKAISAYKSALKLDPSHSLAWNNLGGLYLEDELTGEAIDCFRQALSLDAELTAAWQNLGRAYAGQGRNEEALEAYQKVLARSPDDAHALFQSASIYYESGQTEEAVALYERLLSRQPEHKVVLNNLGLIYVEKGIDSEKGIQLLERAVSLSPGVPQYLDSLGWAHYRLGNLQEARRHLERAARFAPGNREIQEHYRVVAEALEQ